MKYFASNEILDKMNRYKKNWKIKEIKKYEDDDRKIE